MASLIALTRPRSIFSPTLLSKLAPFTARYVHTVDTKTYQSEPEDEQKAEACKQGSYSKYNQMQSSGEKGPFQVKKSETELFIRVDMPGVATDNIKVWVENESVCFRGYGSDDSDHKEGGRDYAGRFVCSSEFYKVSEVKAVLKNGVLRMLVPKKNNEGGVTQ